jgi:hypothetical protein
MWGEAARKLSDAVNDELFRSLEGKSKHQLWLELCDIITKHPSEVSRLKVDAILRSGIRKFTDEVSHGGTTNLPLPRAGTYSFAHREGAHPPPVVHCFLHVGQMDL